MEKNTREDLIDSAFKEIFENGYQGASLTTILKNANVHKGSMYHFFSNKKELALVSIKEKIYSKFEERYTTIINLESNYLESFIASIKDITQRDFNLGCPIANIIQEMSNIDRDFNILMKDIYSNFRNNIKEILDKAIEAKEMKVCNSSKLALYVISTLEGAILSAKASGNIQDYVDVIEILSNYIISYKI